MRTVSLQASEAGISANGRCPQRPHNSPTVPGCSWTVARSDGAHAIGPGPRHPERGKLLAGLGDAPSVQDIHDPRTHRNPRRTASWRRARVRRWLPCWSGPRDRAKPTSSVQCGSGAHQRRPERSRIAHP
ncbi:hypothetical protein NKH77_29090 [Streptomyces sp. M19]